MNVEETTSLIRDSCRRSSSLHAAHTKTVIYSAKSVPSLPSHHAHVIMPIAPTYSGVTVSVMPMRAKAPASSQIPTRHTKPMTPTNAGSEVNRGTATATMRTTAVVIACGRLRPAFPVAPPAG